MAEINIPMRTKSSMDLGTVLRQTGEERIRPALELRELQTGMQQRQRERPERMPQAAGTQNRVQGSTQPRQQAGTQPNTAYVRHYDVRPEGGTVLNKGGKVSFRSLFPGNPGKVEVVMGWDAERLSLDDVDASCYLLGENGKVIGDDWFVFYNQPSSPDGAVSHQGKGSGGKRETITVDFNRLNPKIKRLAFVLTINEAQEHGFSFSQVGNAHVRIRDGGSKRELALFNLSDYYEGVTAMTVCEFYDYHGEWKINPVGHGLKNTGLLELCRFYGVRVE